MLQRITFIFFEARKIQSNHIAKQIFRKLSLWYIHVIINIFFQFDKLSQFEQVLFNKINVIHVVFTTQIITKVLIVYERTFNSKFYVTFKRIFFNLELVSLFKQSHVA